MPEASREKKTLVAKSEEFSISRAEKNRVKFDAVNVRKPRFITLESDMVGCLMNQSANLLIITRPAVCPVNMIPISTKLNELYFSITNTGSKITQA